MGELVLCARGLAKHYRRGLFGLRTRKVFQGLDFQVQQGDIWALTGSNGAGKSTLLRCLIGLLRPDAGEATVMSRPAFAEQGHPSLGYVPDLFATYSELTVTESLAYYGALSQMAPDVLSQRTAWALRRMHLEEVAHERVSNLSKGLNQRLGLAQSLLHDPDLVVWDEPSSGLDPLGRALVVDLVKDLKAAGKTVLFSTHILADVERCCDHLAVLVGGELRAAGPIEDLKAARQVNTVEDLFAALAGPQAQDNRGAP